MINQIENNQKIKELLESDDAVDVLTALRLPILKLSELHILKIQKPTYNQWKKRNLLSSFLQQVDPNSTSKWQKFSILEVILLQIIRILWESGTDDNDVEKIIKELVDGASLNELIDAIITSKQNGQNFFTNQSLDTGSLITYLVSQKLANPQLFLVTLLEAYILLALKTGKLFSLIVFEGGAIDFIFEPVFSNTLNKELNNDLFYKQFQNIPITSLLHKALSLGSNPNESSVLTRENTIVSKLIEKGYTLDTLTRIFSTNSELQQYEERTIEKTTGVNISTLINETPNQDIIIKIRNSKKESISIIKYKTK